MAVSKLICPKCNKVLRPAKPLPAGKPVKCPECGNRFTAPEEDAPKAPLKTPKKAAADESEAAEGKPKKPADAPKAAPKKKAAPAAEKKPAAKKDDDDDEGGVYGYVKEDVAEEEDKPDIEYAPDMSTKDLRGPAVSALVQPSNALIIVGGAGFFGWLALIFLHLFPILFPIDIDEGDKTKPAKPVVAIEAALAPAALNLTVPATPPANNASGPPSLPPELQPSAKAMSPYMAFILMDPSGAVRFSWAGKTLIFLIMILGMVYSGFVAYGAVRIQNLDGYRWGVAACVMAIVPFWTLYGFSACVAQLARFLFGMVLDDPFTLARAWNAALSLPMLAGMAVGVWTLTTLRSEKVVKGFEYKAE